MAELNAMLHRIQISMNPCEVTMQVKRAIGKAFQYITNTCASVESPHHFALFVVCFPIVVKALLHGFDPYIKRFPRVANDPRSHICIPSSCYAMKRSIEICPL